MPFELLEETRDPDNRIDPELWYYRKRYYEYFEHHGGEPYVVGSPTGNLDGRDMNVDFPAFVDGYGQIPIVALVTSLDAWHELRNVICGVNARASIEAQLTNTPFIVTGRIYLQELVEFANNQIILAMMAPQLVRPMLYRTLAEIWSDHDAVFHGNRPVDNGGKGVVVGVVDYGCDFRNDSFLDAKGKSRILHLWDQSAAASKHKGKNKHTKKNQHRPQPYSPDYGRVHSRHDINTALKKKDPYGYLDYKLHKTEKDVTDGTHGTHVLDIAAGSSKPYGVASKAEIIFVDLCILRTPILKATDFDKVVEKNFGDSVRLLEALRFIFDKAGAKPCVVNLSLGTYCGPHDGTNLVERFIDALVKEAPNRCVVVAAGNSYEERTHASGMLKTSQKQLIPLSNSHAIKPTPTIESKLEIWYPATDTYNVRVFRGDGSRLFSTSMSLNSKKYVTKSINGQEYTVGIITHSPATGVNANNGCNVIRIMQMRLYSGWPYKWSVHLTCSSTNRDRSQWHAWVERNDYEQMSFEGPTCKAAYTLGV